MLISGHERFAPLLISFCNSCFVNVSDLLIFYNVIDLLVTSYSFNLYAFDIKYSKYFHQSWHSSIEGVLFKMLDIMEFTPIDY